MRTVRFRVSEALGKVQADALAWGVSRICNPETEHLEAKRQSRCRRRLGEPYIWEEVCRFQSRGLNAVHLRHHDTCHEEFELKVPGKFDARFTAVHSPRLKSIRIQDHGDCVRYCYIVIDNESVRLSPEAISGRLGKLRLRDCHVVNHALAFI